MTTFLSLSLCSICIEFVTRACWKSLQRQKQKEELNNILLRLLAGIPGKQPVDLTYLLDEGCGKRVRKKMTTTIYTWINSLQTMCQFVMSGSSIVSLLKCIEVQLLWQHLWMLQPALQNEESLFKDEPQTFAAIVPECLSRRVSASQRLGTYGNGRSSILPVHLDCYPDVVNWSPLQRAFHEGRASLQNECSVCKSEDHIKADWLSTSSGMVSWNHHFWPYVSSVVKIANVKGNIQMNFRMVNRWHYFH